MLESLKARLLRQPSVRQFWARRRGRHQEQRYLGWSEKFGRMAEERGLVYTQRGATDAIRSHMAGRDITRKRIGQFNSAVATRTDNWGISVVQEMSEVGSAHVFDWWQRGYRDDPRRVPEMNQEFFQWLKETHAREPLDWALIMTNGSYILKSTLRRIREELGIPTVHQWLDCKQTFIGGMGPHGQDVGQIDVAPEFDVVWTSSRATCEWYMAIGARPLFLPEGFSPRQTPKLERPKVADVGFLGASYGLRPDYIEALRKAGLSVLVAGHGWQDGRVIGLEEMGEFFASSKLNLGIGGVGYSMKLTTLKGRDFEVPGAGGAYLTTFNADLAQFFDIGREIACYQSMEEMVEVARRLVRDDQARLAMAERGYARALREHRWMHRFLDVLRALGAYDEAVIRESEAGSSAANANR